MIKRILAGTLALVSGLAFGTTLVPIQLLNPAGSAAGQAIVSTGSSSAPAWGSVTATALGAQAANTVVANATGSSASPTAFAMPSCSTSTSALQWANGTGFTCYANSATATGTLAQFAATTSAQLAGVISDETGSGALVFGTSPTIGSPAISGGTISNAPISGSTGAFTTLTASGSVSGAGITALFNNTALAGTPTAVTQGAGSNSTALATTAFVQTSYAAPPCLGCTTPGAVSATSVTHSQQEVDTSFTVSSPTTGGTVTIASGTETALIVPAGSLSTLTVTLPGCTAGYNGSVARFSSTQAVTTLTLNASSGSVVDPVTSLTIGAGHAYLCRGAATAWYPLY
ncbi:hypothetical protein [Paraburkholderia xenovorans]|uniref:hypothetical protein n=1 Tax=Paraburkholderia xenovorans TaxID=36873 RepID=UPI0038BAB477